MPSETDIHGLVSDIIHSFLHANAVYNEHSFGNTLRHAVMIKHCKCPSVVRYINSCSKSAVQLFRRYSPARKLVNIYERGHLRRSLIIEIFNICDYPSVGDQGTTFLSKMCNLLVKVGAIQCILPGLTWDLEVDCDEEIKQTPPGWMNNPARFQRSSFTLVPISFIDSGDFRMQVLLKDYA